MEENLKQCWGDVSFHVDNGNMNRRLSALQSLALRYKRFSVLGMVFALITPITLFEMLYKQEYCDIGMTIVVIAFAEIYFLLASCMDKWLYNGISGIDLSRMSVSDVCRCAYYYRKKHFQFMAVLIPMAMILVGTLVWILSDDIYFILGVVAGGIVGLVSGIFQFRAFMVEYKEIMN